MAPLGRIQGIAAPMVVPNINTDDIFPGPAASPVLRGAAGGFAMDPGTAAANAFAAWRLFPDGSPKADFILNRAPFDRACILLGGYNFGCGSSREHAVWAIKGIGISCVIAPSFGDIFYDNCIKNSVLPARVAPTTLKSLLAYIEGSDDPILAVDLASRTIGAGPFNHEFVIADYPLHLLLNGIDEIDAAIAEVATIKAFEGDYHLRRPWLASSSQGLVRAQSPQ